MDMPKHMKEYWEVELAKQYATITPFEKPKQEDIDFWLALIRSEHWDEICERADREKYLDMAGVVRCGNCKHNVDFDADCPFSEANFKRNDDDFCSCGEEREE